MGDPYRKVRPGQRSGLSAAAWNGFLDGLRQMRQSALGTPLDRTALRRITPSVTCLVKWEGATALPEQSILGFDGVVIDPADRPLEVQRRPALIGVEPAADGDAFCVTTGPVQQNGLVEAVVQGLAVVDVDVTDADHTHATATAGETAHLDSATGGRAEILWKPSGTGVKSCVVLLGSGGGGCEGVVCTDWSTHTNQNTTYTANMNNGDELVVWPTITPVALDTPTLIQGGILGGMLSVSASPAHSTTLYARLVIVDADGAYVSALSGWVPLGHAANNSGAYWTLDPTRSVGSGIVRHGSAATRHTFSSGSYSEAFVAWQIRMATTHSFAIAATVEHIGFGATYITTTTSCGTCDPAEPTAP